MLPRSNVRSRSWISSVPTWLMRLLTLGGEGSILLLLMLVVSAGVGTLLFLDLHRFFIAISRAVVNHDNREGTAPDPLVWSAGALPKRRRLLDAVRNSAMLPGPAVIWTSDWVSVPPVVIAADDVCAWPYCVGIQVKWDAFLNTLHWPASGAGLGVGWVSYVELLSIV